MIVASSPRLPDGYGFLVFGGPRGGARRAEGADLGEGPHREPGGLGARLRVGRGRIEEEDGREAGHGGLARDYLGELLLVLEDGDAALAEIQDVADLLLGGVAAPGHVGGAEAEDREVGDEPFPAVVRDEADMVASGHAELEETRGEDLDVLEEGGVAPGS